MSDTNTTYDVQKLRDKGLIIFESIMGSRAYGTSLPTSDTDIRGVFIQPVEDILGNEYVEQVSDKTNDIVFYEIRRFLELVATNNPNILELLNAPSDCVIFKDPIFDLVLERKDEFITKHCKNSFGGYAIAQIRKAKGYNKKINWDENKMKRKTVLDFCYVLKSGDSMPFYKWMEYKEYENLTHKDFGLAKVNHARDLYAMYRLFEDENPKGIVRDAEKSNDIQLVSIPKGRFPEAYLSFNKDGYSTHCKEYNSYQTWLKERNDDRFKMNKDHGKNYDSKNMMHTFRLLSMAMEIADGQINVRRPKEEIAVLMKIRKGEYEYNDLIRDAEKLIKQVDEKFKNSNLPTEVNSELVKELLIKIRKQRYKI